MKKTYIKIISKKILTTAFLTGSVAMEAIAEYSEPESNYETITTNIKSNVEFTGTADNAYAFNIKIANPDAETVILEIKNDNGQLMLTEKYKDIAILENIKILNEEIKAYYHFTIKPENKESEESFVVSIVTKLMDERTAA